MTTGFINAMQLSQDIANNVSKPFLEQNQSNKIAQILEEAQRSGDPNAMQQSITKILQQVRPERQAQAVELLQGVANNIAAKNQKQAWANQGYDPNLPQAANIQEMKNRGAIAKEQAKVKGQEGDEFNKIREKQVAELTNKYLDEAKQGEEQKYAIETARKAIKGNISGPGIEAYLKSNPYTGLLIGLTPDESSLMASNKKLLEGSKGLFGSKPTEREIFILLEQFLPSISKTKEANEAGLRFVEQLNDIKILRGQLVDELTNGGTKYVPNLEIQLDKLLKPYGDNILAELKAHKGLEEVKTEDKPTEKKPMSEADNLLEITRKRREKK